MRYIEDSLNLIISHTKPREGSSAGITASLNNFYMYCFKGIIICHNHDQRQRPKSSAAISRQLSTGCSSQDYLDVEMQLNGYLVPHASFDIKLTKSNHKQRIFSTKVRQPKYPLVLQQVGIATRM